MNARLYIMKTNAQRQQEAHDHVSAKHRVEMEMVRVNRFVWKYLAWFCVFTVLVSTILWIADAHSCETQEPESLEIKITEAI